MRFFRWWRGRGVRRLAGRPRNSLLVAPRVRPDRRYGQHAHFLSRRSLSRALPQERGATRGTPPSTHVAAPLRELLSCEPAYPFASSASGRAPTFTPGRRPFRGARRSRPDRRRGLLSRLVPGPDCEADQRLISAAGFGSSRALGAYGGGSVRTRRRDRASVADLSLHDLVGGAVRRSPVFDVWPKARLVPQHREVASTTLAVTLRANSLLSSSATASARPSEAAEDRRRAVRRHIGGMSRSCSRPSAPAERQPARTRYGFASADAQRASRRVASP